MPLEWIPRGSQAQGWWEIATLNYGGKQSAGTIINGKDRVLTELFDINAHLLDSNINLDKKPNKAHYFSVYEKTSSSDE